jgi:hypothetical protein
VAERLVAAAQVAILTDQAPTARTIIDRDRTLLAAFDAQIAEADQHLAALPGALHSPCSAAARAGGCPGRHLWRRGRRPSPGAHRPAAVSGSGLCPATYASAGRRHDGAISREGSVTLHRAVLSLGLWLWRLDPRPPVPMPPCCGPAASYQDSSGDDPTAAALACIISAGRTARITGHRVSSTETPHAHRDA